MSDAYHLHCYDCDTYIEIGQSGGVIYSCLFQKLTNFLRVHQGHDLRFEWSGNVGHFGVKEP